MSEESGWRARSKSLQDSGSIAGSTTDPNARQLYEFGPYRLDPAERKLVRGNEIVALPPKAFDTLVLMVRNSGHLLEKDELMRTLWPDAFVEEGSLSNNIFLLRKALGEDTAFIETVPRRGYRFVGAVRRFPLGGGGSGEDQAEAPPAPEPVPSATVSWVQWRKVGTWILASAICSIALMLVYFEFRPRAEPSSFNAVPFAAYPGVEGCPAFSPDGSQIVFSWNGDPESQLPRSAGYSFSGAQSQDLYVKVIGHENPVRLTHHPSEWICPAWSPDGKQIAFHRVSGTDTGVYVVPALGGPERKLRSTTRSHWFEVVPISWSPDGKWIAYVDSPAGNEGRLFLLSVETLERKEIPHPAGCLADWLPAFSHSGKQLAYFCLHNPNNFVNGLYVLEISDGLPHLLTTVDGYWGPGPPAWTADDRKLVFANPQYGTAGMGSSLYEKTLVGGALAKLPLAQNAYEPTISGKGDKLAFVSTISDGHMEIWRKDLLNQQAPGMQLVPSSFEQREPEYAPDGRHIAFVSKRSGMNEIWVSDADGRNLVQISNLKDSRTAGPHWSPDSRKLVFYSAQAGRGEVYIADISERMPRKLVTNIADIAFPNWSHDGQWIYFMPVGTNHGIYRCPANGGDADLLVALPQADLGENPQEAFDGETVYFSRVGFDTPLEMVSIKRPGNISVLQGMPKVLNLFAWTVVPGGIYFVPAETPKSVHYFDFVTKQVRPVLEMEKDFGSGLSVSVDGRWILYSQSDEINSNVMLVEKFR